VALNPSGTALELIERLIGFPTVSRESNLDLIDWAESLLTTAGFRCRRFVDPEGRKANLLATMGPEDRPGILLSGHSDVVPVEGQDWSSDPFVVRRADDRLYGRGACDMKGFIGLVLDAATRLRADTLAVPVHIALSYDEEVGCAGVRSLVDHIAAMETRPALAIIGEPTDMQVVTAHKGIEVIRTRIRGRAAHSSLPEAGANVLYAAADLLTCLRGLAGRLAKSPRDSRFDPPYTSLNPGRLEGGAAVNIIAEEAVLDWEFRPLPGIDPETVLDEVRAHAETVLLPALRAQAEEADIVFERLAAAPALDSAGGEDAAAFVSRLLGANDSHAVSFTTEAGLFQGMAGVPSVVCGPGSIAQAHKADEYVTYDQLARAEAMIADVLKAASSGLGGPAS